MSKETEAIYDSGDTVDAFWVNYGDVTKEEYEILFSVISNFLNGMKDKKKIKRWINLK